MCLCLFVTFTLHTINTAGDLHGVRSKDYKQYASYKSPRSYETAVKNKTERVSGVSKHGCGDGGNPTETRGYGSERVGSNDVMETRLHNMDWGTRRPRIKVSSKRVSFVHREVWRRRWLRSGKRG